MMLSLFSGWLLVAKNRECTGSETDMETLESIDDCSNKCKGNASMFISTGTHCICETSAIKGECDQIDLNYWDLYKYQGNISFLCVKVIIITIIIITIQYKYM